MYIITTTKQNQREVRYVDGETCNNGPNHRKPTEKSSSLAQKAAQEAKAASDAQQIAGQQAARQVLTSITYAITLIQD